MASPPAPASAQPTPSYFLDFLEGLPNLFRCVEQHMFRLEDSRLKYLLSIEQQLQAILLLDQL